MYPVIEIIGLHLINLFFLFGWSVYWNKAFIVFAKLKEVHRVIEGLILSPIAEEIFFRNITFSRYLMDIFSRSVTKTKRIYFEASIWTSICFSISHWQMLFVVSLRKEAIITLIFFVLNSFLVGLIFSLVTVLTGNIYLSIILHSVNNMISLLLSDEIMSRTVYYLIPSNQNKIKIKIE
ncbi:hypothetical protein M0811_05860 [Anaeramoeba ignava]|uniref:CAAX prenyl protease 2/Lysostaphin resistance protein A-like domain-containing protein n=1 Tax=Anaeramoeba ignava TaxID=1746090 RepID=A0A9Q0RF56_ANAIG|nr:hypothetical protein M0811_05860 [Anaeramoeba ignava]